MFKKSLNVYDTWFGFYGDFKKGTFGLPYEHGRTKWVNPAFGLVSETSTRFVEFDEVKTLVVNAVRKVPSNSLTTSRATVLLNPGGI